MDIFDSFRNTNKGDAKMIYNHEIKMECNEEVLYLFLDFNTEFASFSKYHKKTTLNKEINNYIDKNKINFMGKKIVLVASGLVIASVLITKIPFKNKHIDTHNYATTILLNDSPKIDNSLKEVSNDKKEIKNESPNIQNDVTNKTEHSKPSNNDTTQKPASETKPTTPPPTNNKPINKPIETEKNEVTIKKEMITIKRSNGTILNLELEEYIIGVVAAEMPASFEIEALKAQAIAARTYALKAKEDNVTLTDTVSTQSYKDNEAPKALWGSSYNTYYNKIKNAVQSTEGLVMTYNGSLINAFYHSTSNGYTEDSTAVFGAYPYLKSVESNVDKKVSSYKRVISMTYEDINKKLGIPVTSTSEINYVKNSSNRVDKIIIDNNIYDGIKFRNILGLRSTDFTLTLNESNISITTLGYGHGVGMSQYGAHEYSKLGWSYSDILKHYYTGITITKR